MMSSFLLPVISIPTKIYTVNDTLIDNIFTNEFNPDFISGNFTDISDHLPSFLIIPKNNKKKLPQNHNIYTRDPNKVDYENFFLDLLAIDMVEISNNPNANDAFNNLFESTSKVINDYPVSAGIMAATASDFLTFGAFVIKLENDPLSVEKICKPYIFEK